ncbi:MAG: DUF6438 domain-containing protein [Saprospiraceae bacterium]
MHYLSIFLFSLLSITAACNGTKTATSAMKKASFTQVELIQGGCFGTCPVYDLTISPKGEAIYLGKRYAPYKGLHTGMLQTDSLVAFNAQVKEILAKADNLKKEIDSGIADMATSIIIIRNGADSVRFIGTSEFEPEIEVLRQQLFSISKSTAWTRSPDAEPIPASQLLVTLKAADQVQIVTEEYYRQQLKVVRMTSKEPPVFLMQFDPYTMSAEEMVRDLRRQHAVVNVVIVEEKE